MKLKNGLTVLVASALMLVGSSVMAQSSMNRNTMNQNSRQAPKNALQAGQSALSFQVPTGGNPYVDSDTVAPQPDSSGSGGLGGLGGLASGVASAVPATALGYHYMFTDKVRGGINLGFTYANDQVARVAIAPQFNYYTDTRGTVAPFGFGQVAYASYNDFDQNTFSLKGGYGVEWFPVTRFSISGQIGLQIDVVNPSDNFGLNLFTSSLAANLYF